jgi:hypothetical protein
MMAAQKAAIYCVIVLFQAFEILHVELAHRKKPDALYMTIAAMPSV